MTNSKEGFAWAVHFAGMARCVDMVASHKWRVAVQAALARAG
jgi:hypothetical protein